MSRPIRFFLFLAIVFAPFTIWFALGDYARINLVFLGMASILSLFDRGKNFCIQRGTELPSLCMFAILVIIIASFFINLIIRPQEKLVSNFVGTIAIISLMYFYYSFLIENYLPIKRCIKAIAYSGLLLMCIISLDSILVNFFSYEISSWFEWGKEITGPYFRRGLWISTAAPAAEPAHLMTFLNIQIPFVLYYFKGKWRLFLIMVYAFCLFSSFSVTAYATLLLVPFILLLSDIPSKYKTKILFFIILFSIIIMFSLFYSSFFNDFLASVHFVDKISMSGNTTSDSERSEGMLMGIRHGLESPIYGMGPGYGKTIIKGGYLSLFLSILGCYGFIAFVLFVTFWLIYFYKCIQIKGSLKLCFLISLSVTIIASCLNDNIHTFMIWMILPMIIKASSYQRKCLIIKRLLIITSKPQLFVRSNKIDN